jgi:1,4-alpha-glucan branching enzyme
MVTGATSLIGDTDLHLFNEGSHLRLWEKLGAHPGTSGARAGTHFAVWAPGAERVSVIGDWNGWNRDAAPLAPRGDSGIWEGFVPGVERRSGRLGMDEPDAGGTGLRDEAPCP